MVKPHAWQVEHLAGPDRAPYRRRPVKVERKRRRLHGQLLGRRRARVDAAPGNDPLGHFHLQLKPQLAPPLGALLRGNVAGGGVVADVETVVLGGGQQEEVLLAGQNDVNVVVVVLVEGGDGVGVAYPEVDGLGEAAERLGGPRHVRVHVTGDRRVLPAEAVVLLLRVRYQAGGRVGSPDKPDRGREVDTADVRGRKAPRGPGSPWVRVRGKRIGAPVGGEVEGDGGGAECVGEVGGGGPERRGGPVASGRGGDEERAARGDVVAEERERRRGQADARHGGGVLRRGREAQQVPGLRPQLAQRGLHWLWWRAPRRLPL